MMKCSLVPLLLWFGCVQATDLDAQRQVVSQQALEQAYRQAAWYFYQDEPYDALLQLDVAGDPALAPLHDARSDVLKAGLLLQIGLPKPAAELMQQLIQQGDTQLPSELRQYALLQYSRYLLSQGDKALATRYLQQLAPSNSPTNSPTNEPSQADQQPPPTFFVGAQQQLQQLLDWPHIKIPAEPDFAGLAGQPEMPYVIINQIQALAAQGDVDKALQWQQQLAAQLGDAVDPWFWQRWFGFSPVWLVQNPQEQTAIVQYVQLLRAQLLVKKQDYASAQQVLASFPQHSALDELALSLYATTLEKSGQTALLLGVYQQLLRAHPLAPASWQAAHAIGNGLEKLGEKAQALAAYQWAETYYSDQLRAHEQIAALTLDALQQDQLSPWQRYQLKQDRRLYQAVQDLHALGKLTQRQPGQQGRIQHLQQVVALKLHQQQQLLTTQLPQLQARHSALTERAAQLRQAVDAAVRSPYPTAWLPQPLFGQQQRLQRANDSLAALRSNAGAKPDTLARQQARIEQLQGLLQWRYAEQQADARWQWRKELATIDKLLPLQRERLTQLSQHTDATPRLQAQQQRLLELQADQATLMRQLQQAQTQLVADLNRLFADKAQQQQQQLKQWSRLNKQALARLLEERLQEQP